MKVCEKCGSECVSYRYEFFCHNCGATHGSATIADLRRQLAAVTAERDEAWKKNSELVQENESLARSRDASDEAERFALEDSQELEADRDAARAEVARLREALGPLLDEDSAMWARERPPSAATHLKFTAGQILEARDALGLDREQSDG